VIAAVLAWCIFGASLLTVGAIENAALQQPSVADAVFNHPLRVKGVVRFISSGQQRIYSIAYPIMRGVFPITLFLFVSVNRLYDKIKKDRIRRLLREEG
jgi:hypothetical protein